MKILLHQPTATINPYPRSDDADIVGNAEFNQATGAVLQSAPAVALAIPAALAQVATNGIAAFSLVFGPFCQLASISAPQRGVWADLAVDSSLPADFIAAIRGQI